MFMEERHHAIRELICRDGKITIAQITAQFGISEESARRDLRILEQRGLCKRTHGGAIAPQQVSVRPPADRDFDQMPIFPTYREISRIAAGFIQKNDIVYLTGGSFGHIIIPYLPRDFSYTLVVNSVEMGHQLRSLTNADIYVAGGKMRPSGTMTDTMALDFVSRMHFDRCFLTGAGLTASFGLSNGTEETAAFQRMILKNSRISHLLIPGIKVGADSFLKVCDADAFSSILTDWECPEEQLDALKDLGIQVITAEEVR